MQAAKGTAAGSALPQSAGVGLESDGDADRAWTNPTRVARSIRATEARNQSGRRRLVDPTTCDRDYSAAEMEFMQAIQTYKQRAAGCFRPGARFWRCLQGLGYQKATRRKWSDRSVSQSVSRRFRSGGCGWRIGPGAPRRGYLAAPLTESGAHPRSWR